MLVGEVFQADCLPSSGVHELLNDFHGREFFLPVPDKNVKELDCM